MAGGSVQPATPAAGRSSSATAPMRYLKASPARAVLQSGKTCEGCLLDVIIEHRPMLIGVARSVVGCASRAEDVVHDVFLKLTELPDHEGIRQPLAYVTRMVRNASIDHFRRQNLESLYHAAEDDGLDVPSPAPTPESALATRDALRHAFDALAQLPARTRTAFEMVRLREQTLQDAARALNVSQTLVHFMVRDAAKHCADCLAARDNATHDAPCADYADASGDATR